MWFPASLLVNFSLPPSDWQSLAFSPFPSAPCFAPDIEGHNSGPRDCARPFALGPNPSAAELAGLDFPSAGLAPGHGRLLSAEYARFATSGVLLLRPRFGDACRTCPSDAPAPTEPELLLRFLTGDACRDGDDCLIGDALRRLPAAAAVGDGAVPALLYLDVISMVRAFRTTLTFSAGGSPP